jgi:ElaB/YqjD/DUF883 family membrane-anchored ribosome-binding protein
MEAETKGSQAMRKEMRHIMEHAQKLVDATSGEVDDRIKSARAALKGRLESAKSEFDEVEARLSDTVQAAGELVREKPFYAIGGALAAGLFLGWFMSRK